MIWPVSRKVHPDPVFLEMLQTTIATTAKSIVQFEPVYMLAAAADHAWARKQLGAAVEL